MENVGMPQSINASIEREPGLFQRTLDRSCLVRAFPPASITLQKQKLFGGAPTCGPLEEICGAGLQYDCATASLPDVVDAQRLGPGVKVRIRASVNSPYRAPVR